MNIKPTSLTIDGSIQRVYGSDIVVPLKLKALVDGVEIESSGVGYCQNISDIKCAWNDAYNMAVSLLKELSKPPPKLNFLKIMQNIISYEKTTLRTAPNSMISEKQLTLLVGPPNKNQQQELSQLCEQLGIESIEVVDNPEWTMIRVHALIAELKKSVRVYETDVDKEILTQVNSK